MRFALAALAALVPSWASAQDGGVSYTEEIEVTGHYENAVGTSEAASQGKVTRQLVEDRPILRPGEVLELVPGLIVTQHSGAGKANQYFLRGFNLDHGTDFATTLDGMPINLRSHAHGQGYTDLNFLIPELIQRVDYFKGPYFASKGDFASAGAAEIHTATVLPKTMFELTGGMYGYGRGLFAGSPEVAGGKLLYGIEAFHDDGPWQRPDDYRRLNGILRYSRASDEARWDVTAMAYRGIWNATDQIPLRAVDAIGRFGTEDPTTGGDTYRFSLSGGYARPIGSGMFEANVYAVRYRLDLFSNFTWFLRDPATGDQIEQLDDRWMLGTSGGYDWAADPGALIAHAAAGWEVRHDRVDPVALYDTATRDRLATVRQDFVRETSGTLFADAELAPAPWLRAIGGVRYDHYFFDVISDRPANSGRDDAGRFSPKLSVIAGPWARTEVFVNAGLGFHSNDARGVTTRVDPGSGEPVQPVTPLAGTRGAEIGARTEVVPGVQASLALWALDLDSELLFTGDEGNTEPMQGSRRRGIELNAHWRPLRWLLFDLELAFSRARFVDGAFIPGAVAAAGSAGVTVHELGPWSASLYTRYFGPRPLTAGGDVRSTASTLFNAQVSWRALPWLRLTADVFNLFDAQVDDIAYFYTSRLQTENEPHDDVHFHPAGKRSLRAAATLTW